MEKSTRQMRVKNNNKNMRTRNKTRLNMKLFIVKSTKPHKMNSVGARYNNTHWLRLNSIFPSNKCMRPFEFVNISKHERAMIRNWCNQIPYPTQKIKWASSWDYGTYHIGDQRRLRREPTLFAYMKYGSRRRVLQKIRHLVPLDGCAFEEWVYGGRKEP